MRLRVHLEFPVIACAPAPPQPAVACARSTLPVIKLLQPKATRGSCHKGAPRPVKLLNLPYKLRNMGDTLRALGMQYPP